MKKIICCLLVAVMLSACGGESKQENAPRKEGEKRVGDIIMVNGELGVVFAVTTDGQHGKVMSVTEASYMNWSHALAWCSNLGSSWHLPTREDLMIIYSKKKLIDFVLSANGYTTISDVRYWSSESYEKTCAWYVHMRYGRNSTTPKDDGTFVRAVSVF